MRRLRHPTGFVGDVDIDIDTATRKRRSQA
jgi:hypothetical protein